MTKLFDFYSMTELPAGNLDKTRIIECIGRQNFMLVYDFLEAKTIIGLSCPNSKDVIKDICNSTPGIGFIETDTPISDRIGNYVAYSAYRKLGKFDNKLFYDSFDLIDKGFIAILFVNTPVKDAAASKLELESILSTRNNRETELSIKAFGSRQGLTMQRDLYYNSDEKQILGELIDSLNSTMLSNGLVYRVFIIVSTDQSELLRYVDTRFLLLSEYALNRKNIRDIVAFLSNRKSLPYGINHSREFVNFYGPCRVNHFLPTATPLKEEGVSLGTFVKDGCLETHRDVNIEPSTLNLGFILTGLPGSGKTREAMHVLDRLLSEKGKRPAIFVLTPTSEWDGFAAEHGMFFIKLCMDDIPINFFRCPDSIETEKFYENLAMILSSAANAGPYRNPMEKCMLNAFRRVYEDTRRPDPVVVYDEIEKSVAKYHGKKTQNSVKYTKHGENIRSALEGLRGIINKPQYCVSDGLNVEDLIERGAIFDISSAGGLIRQQLYALVLNQVYSISGRFDTNGDDKLRMVMCIEEAQTIFGDPSSPAVEDIKQRIQDFRKQGIGLILISHNAGDIDVGIRRLCQIKLYLKQAPDTAAMASKDLIFANAEQDDVVLKLKTLDSRIGALNYISKQKWSKRQNPTIFVKTIIYDAKESGLCNPLVEYIRMHNLKIVKRIRCSFEIRPLNYKNIKDSNIKNLNSIKLIFLGEDVGNITLGNTKSSYLFLYEGKTYRLQLLDKKGRVLKESLIKASENIRIDAC